MNKKHFLLTLGALIFLPLTVLAVNITVPSAPGYGYGLVSTSTGAYVYVSTSTVTCGSGIVCTGTPGSTLGGTNWTISASGGSSDPFYHPAANQSATTSTMLLFGSASTTQFTATSSIWFTGLTSGVIESDANGLLYREATSSVSSAGKIVVRDANLNAYAQNFVSAGTSFPTNGGTVTLTNASPRSWIFTGTNTETMKLPSGTTLTVGTTFTANNNSTLNVTIVDNGSNVLATVLPGGKTELVISDVSTTNGSWDAHALLGHGVTSGTNFLASTAASTTLFSNFGTAYFGGNSTTTIVSDGSITTPTAAHNSFANSTTTNSTISTYFEMPHVTASPSFTIAGQTVVNSNSAASSSISFGDGSSNHNLFSVHSFSFTISSSTLSYDGAYVNGTSPYFIFGTGSASTTATLCSTTGTSVTYSSNNTFTGRQRVYVAIGTSSGTTTLPIANPIHSSTLRSAYCSLDAATPNQVTVTADVEDSN